MAIAYFWIHLTKSHCSQARLSDLVTEVDYEKRLGGDGKVDFTLTSDSSIGIQVKARHGSLDTVRWWISQEEIEKNTALVCILIQEEVNEAQPKYNLITAGFLPTNMINVSNGVASLGIDVLLYCGGLHSYLSSFKSYKSIDSILQNELIKSQKESETPFEETKEKYIERQIISLLIEYFILGNICYEKQDYQGAFNNYNQVIQLNPNISDAYLCRGCTRCVLGDLQGATDDFNQAILINPVEENSYFSRGNLRYEIGDVQGAIEDFNQGLKINPKSAYAFFRRGTLHYKIGNNEVAIDDYTQSLRISPKSAEAYLNRGFIRYAIRDTQNAIEDFTQAISINPKLVEAYFWRGAARYDKRVNKGAIVDFTQVIKLNPSYASAYVKRGIAFDAIGEYKRAIEDFDQALIVNPHYADAYENRGAVYYYLNHMQYAIRDLQKAANFYQQEGKEEDYQRVLDMLREIHD